MKSVRTLWIALALLIAAPLSGLETEQWLSSAEEAKPYGGVSVSVIAAAESVVAANVPERLFLDRLKEGVRKGASSERLASAMGEEAERLIFLAGVLDSSGLGMSAERRERALSEGALFLRASVSREEYTAVVRRAAVGGEPVERVSATVAVLAAIDPSRILESAPRLRLAEAITGSSIRTDRIDSLISAFARGRSFGLSPGRIARIFADELTRGGTLAAVDRALSRERKK